MAGRVNGELVDACDLIESDARCRSSPQKMKQVWRSFVTRVHTCWVMPSNSCGRTPKWRSARLSTTVSIMTLILTIR
ncbi:hypothetical protein ACNKHO_09520 [Shigella flexneri]